MPVLVSEFIAAFCRIGALMSRPVAARPASTLMVGAPTANSSAVPETTGTVTGDWFDAWMAAASVRMSFVAVATVGLDIAPSLVKVSERRVLVPKRFSVPPPTSVMRALGEIWPSLAFIVTVLFVAEA